MNNQQTPLEKLISDKERIQRQCKRQEQKLNEDFSYIQENAGSLLLSGLSSLLFPSNKSTTKTNDKNTAPVTALHRFRDLRLFIHSERHDSHRLGSRSTIYYDVGNQKSEKMVLKSLIQEKEITSNN